MRNSNYDPKLFKELTGKDLDTLWSEYIINQARVRLIEKRKAIEPNHAEVRRVKQGAKQPTGSKSVRSKKQNLN